MKKVFPAIMIIVFYCACSNLKRNTRNPDNTNFPKIDFNIALDNEQKQLILKTARSYFKKYGVPFKVQISQAQSGCDTVIRKDGAREITLATATYKHIYICGSMQAHKIEDLITHELFHSVASRRMKKCKKFLLRDSSIVIGFTGLVVNLKISHDEETFFHVFDEAAAEACAWNVKKDRQIGSLHYANVGSKMIKKVLAGYMTFDDLILFQRTSDVMGFVAKWLSKSRNETTMKDLDVVMAEFYECWEKTN